MQTVKGVRHGISRMVLTMIVTCTLAVLLVSSETTNGTEDVLQSSPYEHSHPECVTREDVRHEIRTVMGPIIESLVQESSAAIKDLKIENDKVATQEYVEAVVLSISGALLRTSEAIKDLRIEIDELQKQMDR